MATEKIALGAAGEVDDSLEPRPPAFSHVAVGPIGLALDDSGEGNDPRIGIQLFYPRRGRRAVHEREPVVEQNDVGLEVFAHAQRVASVNGFADLPESLLDGEGGAQKASDRRIV